MFIDMNRIKICPGRDNDFEEVWKNRDSHLVCVPGLKQLNLVKGKMDENKNFILYASHTIWKSELIS